MRIIGGRPVPLRIGRGLAPVRLELPVDLPPLLATGGHLKAAIALTRGRELFLGQHIGDMDTLGARERYTENVADLSRLLGVKPEMVVHDGHPDYFTTRFADEQRPAAPGHPAPSRPRHGLPGRAWRARACAGDCLGRYRVRNRRHDLGRRIPGGRGRGWRRCGSLWPFTLVGGDRAAREPRRSAVGVCHAAGLDIPDELGFSRAERRAFLASALGSRTAALTTTSAGRLFDAWASLLGVVQRSAYEAEAAMRLEDLADRSEKGTFAVSIVEQPGDDGRPFYRLDWRPWVLETRQRLARGEAARPWPPASTTLWPWVAWR